MCDGSTWKDGDRGKLGVVHDDFEFPPAISINGVHGSIQIFQ